MFWQYIKFQKSVFFYLFFINTIIQEGLLKPINNDSKDAQKICISNKICSFEHSIHQRILKKMYHGYIILVYKIDLTKYHKHQISIMVSEG